MMFHGPTVRVILATLPLLCSPMLSPQASAQSIGPAIFVVNNGSAGSSVTSFRVNADGTLTYADTVVPTGQLNPQTIDVSPNGQWLCVGHGSDAVSPDHLTFIQVHSDATMTQVLDATTPDSPTCVRWLDDSHFVVTNTSASPNDMLLVYEFSPAVPSISQVWFASVSTYTYEITIDRQHKLLYPRAGSFGVWPITWDSNFHLVKLTPAPVGTGVYPLLPGLTPSGTRMYYGGGISGGGHAIGGFDINTTTGAMTPMAGSPYTSAGTSPKQLVVSSDGQFAFASHGTTGDVYGFSIDPATGALSPVPGSYFDVGGQGNCSRMAVLNNRLYVMRYYSSPNDGVLAFQINSDGTLTQIGLPVYPTQGSLPFDIATWPGILCLADIDGDGGVDVDDLLMVINAWGPCGDPQNCPADIDNSGTVDVDDMLAVINGWGPCPNQ